MDYPRHGRPARLLLPVLLAVLAASADGLVVTQRRARRRPRPCCFASSDPPPSQEETETAISTTDGPFDWENNLSPYWQHEPLVLRQAFDASVSDTISSLAWPFVSWTDILRMAQDDDMGQSARLIRHVPGKLDSFDLELGPLDAKDLGAFFESDPNNDDDEDDDDGFKQTVLLNDVDRYIPALADWMDDCFSSKPSSSQRQTYAVPPRWRRDDAQVSLAHTGGGIGPHADDYDVLLIQVSGQRTWLVDANHRLTTQQEVNRLIPDLSVRILGDAAAVDNFSSTRYTKIILEPGDCLYLPPRVVHWGTASSDHCMTLSVGKQA
jgi:50S ribosomal protein L16 3-hydroxylase